MRKMASSGNTDRATSSSSWAEARSRPKGFSTIRRASLARPALPRFLMTVSNSVGGTAR
jgi:hypothetical protein